MNYSHVLWDFNGTILDDVSIGMESINVLLRSRGLRPLSSVEEYHRYFRFPIEEYYRSVGFDFSKDPYDVLAHEWIAAYRAREKSAPLCRGAKEGLEYIKSRSVPQILFSATEKAMLSEQIAHLGIGEYFSELLGRDDVYATGKIPLGKAWIARTNPPRALLIGDTTHDALAAKEMGIECVLIAAGHQSEQTLKTAGVPVLPDLFRLPDFLEQGD